METLRQFRRVASNWMLPMIEIAGPLQGRRDVALEAVARGRTKE